MVLQVTASLLRRKLGYRLLKRLHVLQITLNIEGRAFLQAQGNTANVYVVVNAVYLHRLVSYEIHVSRW